LPANLKIALNSPNKHTALLVIPKRKDIMKKLIIVESPSKAKTIQKYLGSDVSVLASKGHVCDLPQRSMGIDIEHNFKPEYVVSPDKANVIKQLSAAAKKFDEVYLATDPDREGEAISWHLKNTLNISEEKVRIEFHEISPKAVKKAMEAPRQINMDLVDSQQARRVLDRLVGYKISPILAKKVRGGSSAGRVQSAALKMIVEREKQIRAFVPEEYWNIFAHLYKDKQKAGAAFRAAFNDINGKKVKVESKEQAEKILSALKLSDFSVDSVKKGTAESKPQPPFTTSTLQQEASHKLNMSAERSIRVAQQLYEGIDIAGEGQNALITYIRTDSVRVSPDFAQQTLTFIAHNFGKEYAPAKINFYKTKANAQDAHEAIRPISLERTPKSLEGKIERDQHRLYKLIYERYLASQMKNAVFNVMNVHISAAAPDAVYGFTLKGKSVLFKGFTAIYSATDESEDEEGVSSTLPDLDEGEKLRLQKLEHEQKFTKPPARYSDATLVKAMEENGIGRPSTYVSVISVLLKREYTKKEAKNILPTPLGEAVCQYMENYFPDIMNLTFTARMEGELDKIAEGGLKWYELIEKFYPILNKRVINAQKNSVAEKPAQEQSDVVCDKCGAKMIIKDGKYGKFLACPNYPRCKNIKKIVESVAVCPKCGKGVAKKFTKTGKVYYGCTNYPQCDFLSWDLPAPYFCPDCGQVMKISKKEGQTTYICTNKSCGHRETLE
jgi:DNA topoisomerase-1